LHGGREISPKRIFELIDSAAQAETARSSPEREQLAVREPELAALLETLSRTLLKELDQLREQVRKAQLSRVSGRSG
jgi:hypothetical protein